MIGALAIDGHAAGQDKTSEPGTSKKRFEKSRRAHVVVGDVLSDVGERITESDHRCLVAHRVGITNNALKRRCILNVDSFVCCR
jgi:hypothetical protein